MSSARKTWRLMDWSRPSPWRPPCYISGAIFFFNLKFELWFQIGSYLTFLVSVWTLIITQLKESFFKVSIWFGKIFVKYLITFTYSNYFLFWRGSGPLFEQTYNVCDKKNHDDHVCDQTYNIRNKSF